MNNPVLSWTTHSARSQQKMLYRSEDRALSPQQSKGQIVDHTFTMENIFYRLRHAAGTGHGGALSGKWGGSERARYLRQSVLHALVIADAKYGRDALRLLYPVIIKFGGDVSLQMPQVIPSPRGVPR